MDPKELQLPSSSDLLARLRSEDIGRSVAERDDDIEFHMKMADELVRRYKRMKAELANAPDEPIPPNRQVVVDRDQGALAALRAKRVRKKRLN